MSVSACIRRFFCIATIAVAFCIASGSVHAADQVKVHMVNVGNGDCMLIEYNGHYALIDGGRATNAGKYKNGKSVSGDCALDKYSSLSKALNGKLSASNTNKFYKSRNLFSFYEHFDNDLKTLTGSNASSKVIAASKSYLTDFDKATAVRVDYDNKLADYNQRHPEWEIYHNAMDEYEEQQEAWDDYEAAKKTYPARYAEYKQKYAEYEKEYAAWLARNPDGQDDPDDPMPVEPEEPIEPEQPDFPRPTQEPERPEGDEPAMPVNNSGLDNSSWNLYQQNQSTFDDIRGSLTGAALSKYATSADDVSMFRAFMELQKTSPIKAEKKTSPLFRYYTALGYQYVYKQLDGYVNTTGYINGGYSDCLTYLNKHGIKNIDYLIATHAHVDHVGGLIGILASNKISIKTIYWNGSSYGSGNFRVFEHEMLDRKAAGTKVLKADDTKNSTFTLGGKVKFTQLGDTDNKKWFPAYTREPNQGSTKDKKYMNHIVNNQSLVYRMDFNGTSMLFTGDAEWTKDGWGNNRQEQLYKKKKTKVNVDIYKGAHHLHNNASSTKFNKAMSPVYVLASCGKNNEPHKKTKSRLTGADIWITKGNGEEITAFIGKKYFRVTRAGNKDITRKPAFSHVVSTKSSYGTPNVSKEKFTPSGRTVKALRMQKTRISYYNPPRKGKIKLTVTRGWFYSKIQYQLCAGDKGLSARRWRNGKTASISGNFRGTVYFRLTNKFGRTIICKTDGFETRKILPVIKPGRATLTKHNDVNINWYPAKGAGKYKVWYNVNGKWKSKGTTKNIYMVCRNLPAGKKITFKIQPVNGKGIALMSVTTRK